MRQIFITVTLMLLFGYVSAQEITNVRAATEGTTVAIYYDLAGKSESDVFGVQIFASFNNYVEPLSFISGDVGNRVSTGTGKKANWDFEKELGGYKGEVTFEVRATMVGGYYEFQIPSSYSKFKKGGLMLINWAGGESSEKVMIDLYKGNIKFATITPSIENEGKFNWTVPKKVSSGGDYKVKITNTTNYNNTGFSAEFKIAPKVPAILKVVVGMAVVGTAAYLATSGGGGNGDEIPLLPEPPPAPGRGN